MSESSSIEALAARLRTEIGGLAPGERLPTSRDLVTRYAVGPVTVSRAIARLAAEGRVVTRPGSGTFVAARRPAGTEADTSWQTVALAGRAFDARAAHDLLSSPPAGAITLSGGYLHASLRPIRALEAALARAARRPDAWDRAPAAGITPLRTVFARWAGPGFGPDDVLVTAGGQNALSMVFRSTIAPGSPVLVETPTYRGALAAARAAGLRPVAVPMDADGVRPDLLAEAFAMTGARLFYCQPTFHNPTGTVLSAERRHQILAVARAAGAFIVEDDYARHLGHGAALPRPLAADDADGTVVHLTSLTKPAAPSLRVGAVVARGPVLDRLRALRLVDDFFLARPLQEAAVDLLCSPAWERHLRTLAVALRERCAALAAAMHEHCPQWTLTRFPSGGLHLWFTTPAEYAESTHAALSRGVAVSPGRGYFPDEPPGAYARLNFAAADVAEFGTAARRLA
ncbi:aminotransferase-like domain-containing protein [Hamadaea tsunoensis]|uniref:aminotransferase-like domain-containing protein n=1 Tax=Hamadaea tsunoensis TaxID=53368 RepID=UPI0004273900|nr:PLP-dependent aminotransferase family protein [Hamadaea tsunoensis]